MIILCINTQIPISVYFLEFFLFLALFITNCDFNDNVFLRLLIEALNLFCCCFFVEETIMLGLACLHLNHNVVVHVSSDPED